MLRQHFPHWVSDLYDHYPHDINRADMRKYIILYVYGGVYADLDVECVKPLYNLTAKHRGMYIEPRTRPSQVTSYTVDNMDPFT